MEKAEEISPDPKDIVHLALTFALKANLWSNDKKLKEDQEEITIFATEELVKKTDFLKI